jgi:large subunit ribosomal protein L4
MVKVNSYDIVKEEAGTVEVTSNVLGKSVSVEMLNFVVKDFFHQKREKNALVKNRAAVKGGGAKPWRQKGNGRARAGTNSSPLWVGGGVIFGPQNIKRASKVNKKVKKQALVGSLTAQKNILMILENADKFQSTIQKVKDFEKIVKNRELDDKKILYVSISKNDREAVIGNYNNLKVRSVYGLNVYDILNSSAIIIEDTAVKQLEEIYKK